MTGFEAPGTPRSAPLAPRATLTASDATVTAWPMSRLIAAANARATIVQTVPHDRDCALNVEASHQSVR